MQPFPKTFALLLVYRAYTYLQSWDFTFVLQQSVDYKYIEFAPDGKGAVTYPAQMWRPD